MDDVEGEDGYGGFSKKFLILNLFEQCLMK
jgi:hypothetical protein